MVVVTPETEVTSDEAEGMARGVADAPSEANEGISKTESAPPVSGVMSQRITSLAAGMVPSDIENMSVEADASANDEATSAENEVTSAEDQVTLSTQKEAMPSQTKGKKKTKLKSEGATVPETVVRTMRARATSPEKNVMVTDPNEESTDPPLGSVAPLHQEVWPLETGRTLPGVWRTMGIPRRVVEELRSVSDPTSPDWRPFEDPEDLLSEEVPPHDWPGKFQWVAI